MRVLGVAIGNDHGLGYSTNSGVPGVFGFGINSGANQATTSVRGIQYGAKGQSPTAGLVQLEVGYLTGSYAKFVGEPTSFTQYTFGPQEYLGGQPSEANVRLGTTYNFGLRTGTLAVPSPTLVAIGVATDNTVGSYSPGGPTAADIADAVWDEVRSGHQTAGSYGATSEWVSSGDTSGVTELLTRIPDSAAGTEGGLPVLSAGLTVLAELDSAVGTQITAIETFATRMTTGLVQDGAVYQFTANMLELGPSGGGGGDATLAKQTEILAAIQGSAVIQVASPNVSGNLVLTQGDDYDGVANPKASWTVTTDYTSGWTVRLTIRSATDAVVYTNTGSVVSATVVAVTIAAPTGLTMTGCPGQWQGKFDVELTHSSGKKKTIALGVCYINEDQTR
jgi:hypothetical protein